MSDRLHQFVEEFALAYEAAGIPRTAGRILGWLMVCDPPEQTASQLVEALGSSKASISTMTRLLVQMHLIERVPRRGSRQDYFRIRPGTWSERVKNGLAGLSLYKSLAEKGLRLLENAPPQRSERLQEMRELYAFFEEELQGLFERYERKQRKRKG
ncbi:GbsR/MarR family transcriptional regulator [Meiothermus cerbereus]|jgi:DNA-binding transcriptional regulator GbsR (MarR family)|uniref:GbsR/MarR family transcriptional regulator n=1 Tax=Meiothermus cerbereus TaxID=65552 RepID=UPI0004878590|nr:MarR family transcriptional regulator [Meiothermus cerbereus]